MNTVTEPAWPRSAAEELRRLVATALTEDLDERGDLTTLATVPPNVTATATVRTRVGGVAAGVDALAVTWEALDADVSVRTRVADGAGLSAGDVLAEVTGPARAIFTGERTALNLVGHLSGIATLTAAYVKLAAGRCAIRDTRKTHAGMRALEKAAVVAGGGTNHRFGLSDGLLVKDNHVAAAGGIEAATRAALTAAEETQVQIELDGLEQLEVALRLGARSVLLDNFGLDELSAGVDRCRLVGEPVFVEASGGVNLGTVDGIAGTGVDAIAVGALTHSAPVLDVGLDIDVQGAS